MSKKFTKNRSVDWRYLHVPLKYCNKVPCDNINKEFVLIDDYGKNFLAGYRNNETCRVGRTFLVKKIIKNKNTGFIYKGKFYKLNNSGWVF